MVSKRKNSQSQDKPSNLQSPSKKHKEPAVQAAVGKHIIDDWQQVLYLDETGKDALLEKQAHAQDEEELTVTTTNSPATLERSVLSSFLALYEGDHPTLPPAWVLPGVLVSLVACAYFKPGDGAVFALLAQITLMSVLVWRSSSVQSKVGASATNQGPILNVLRAATGSLVLGLGEGKALYACGESVCGKVLVHMAFAYGAISISDYMFHRFIWHAHWAEKGNSIFWRSIHRHYVQHYLAHHRHSLDKEAIPKMRALVKDPRRKILKEAIEAAHTEAGDLFVLECSDHGFTVGNHRGLFACRFSTSVLQLVLPTGTCIILNAMRQGGLLGMIVHMLSTLIPLYLVIHHDKYHCSPEARAHWADTQGRGLIEKWFWKWSEMDTITEEHLAHHHEVAKHGHRFFGLLPFCRYFIYPVFQTW